MKELETKAADYIESAGKAIPDFINYARDTLKLAQVSTKEIQETEQFLRKGEKISGWDLQIYRNNLRDLAVAKTKMAGFFGLGGAVLFGTSELTKNKRTKAVLLGASCIFIGLARGQWEERQKAVQKRLSFADKTSITTFDLKSRRGKPKKKEPF